LAAIDIKFILVYTLIVGRKETHNALSEWTREARRACLTASPSQASEHKFTFFPAHKIE